MSLELESAEREIQRLCVREDVLAMQVQALKVQVQKAIAERDAARRAVAENRAEVSAMLAEREKLRTELYWNATYEDRNDEACTIHFCCGLCGARVLNGESLIHNQVNNEPCLLDGVQPNMGEAK